MRIWNVIFVEDGSVQPLSSFTNAEDAAKRERELIKENGWCVEDMYTEAEKMNDGYHEMVDSWIRKAKGEREIRTVDDKHYVIYENGRIQIQTTEVENTHCADAGHTVVSSDSDGRPIADIGICVDVTDLNEQYDWLVLMTHKSHTPEGLPDELIGLMNFFEGMRETIREEDPSLCPIQSLEGSIKE